MSTKITKADFNIRKFDIPLPNTNCVSCPVYTKISDIKVSYWGEFGSQGIKYVFINGRGNSTDHMFFGVLETPLLQMIKELNMTDFFIMGLSICRPRDGKTEGTIQQAISCCRDNFETIFQSIIQTNQLLGVPPPIAIVLGFEAMRGLFPDTKKTAKMKDIKNEVYSHSSYPGVKFFVTYNQLIIDKSPDFYGTIKNDLLRIMTLDNPITVDNSNYKTISSIPEFDDLMDELAASDEFSFDIESSGLKYKPMYTVTQKKSKGIKTTTLEIEKSMLIGISFSCKEKSGYYIPLYIKFKHFDDDRIQYLEDYCSPQISFNLPDDTTLDSFGFWFGEPYQEYVRQGIKKLLENDTPKIAHNGKFDVTFLKEWWDINVNNFYYDTMLASYLANENSPNSLEFQSDVNFPDLVGYKAKVYDRLRQDDIDEENYADIPLDIVALYGAKDADATLRLRKVFDKQFDAEYTEYHSNRKRYPDAWVNSAQLLHKLYMPLSKRYGEAEVAGILFDKEYAENTAIQFTEEMQSIQERIDFILKDAGIPKLQEDDDRWINLNSPKQKKLLFFDLLGWPIQKETKSAKDARKYRRGDIIDPLDASTDQDSLKQILEIFYAEKETADRELEIELIELMLDYLKRNKMVSTYLRGPKLYSRLDPDNYLHYSMKLHGTVSGRLSCIDKNTLIETKEGKVKVSELLKRFKKQSQESFYILTHNNTYKKLLNVFTKGIEDMVELELENGKKIQCTERHKLLTTEGWFTVEEIIKQDLEVLTYGD